MRKKLIAVCLVVMFLLTGCNYTQTGIEDLLKPPKLSEQQNEIYTALQASTGSNIRLVYPRKGDFTSAFLINNIDDESTQEAIVFYMREDNVNATNTLRINVLDQRDGEWVSVYDAGIAANEIEKVNFVQSNMNTFIVVGVTASSVSGKSVLIYQYQDGRLVQTDDPILCDSYEVSDIDENGYAEILSISLDHTAKSGSVASLYEIYSYGSVHLIGSCSVDPNVTSYYHLIVGKLSDETNAFYLDGMRGSNQCTTEILVYDKKTGTLENLLYDRQKEINLVSDTVRSSGAVSMDINGDGVIEIPVHQTALGYETEQKHSQEELTEWYVYESGELVRSSLTYVSYSLGYLFTLPDAWEDQVTPVFSANTNELSFVYYADGQITEEKLLSIYVFKSNEYKENSKYILLQNNGQLVYVCEIPNASALSKSARSLLIDEETVKMNFKLYAR